MDDQQLTPFPAAPGDAPPSALTGATEMETEAQSEIDFLTPSPSSMQLADSVVYRQGLVVATALLAGPAICAIAAVVAAIMTGAIPVWLPFALLAWLPALALTWGLLKSVRIAPDSLAAGRPLGRWRVVPFDEIERVEQHGLRLVVRARRGRPLSFTPFLLWQGAQLRRRLLLSLPLGALSSDLRAEARALSGGVGTEEQEGDITGILTVRPRGVWSLLAGVCALLALAGAGAALLFLTAPLSLALAIPGAALGLFALLACLWTIQEIFVSERGLFIQYRALRHRRIVFWTSVRAIEYTPGELALLCRGVTNTRTAICAGPGLLSAPQARLMRGFINRYCQSPVAPLGARINR